MRYRSAAFALKSAHALASPGSTHFPARGVDADALLSPAAVLYLLRFSGDIITAEQTFVTGVVPPVRVVATVVLVAFVEIVLRLRRRRLGERGNARTPPEERRLRRPNFALWRSPGPLGRPLGATAPRRVAGGV